MPIGSRIVSFPCLFLVALLLSHGALGIAHADDPSLSRVAIRHHDIFAQIVPEQHALIATDRLTLEVPRQKSPIHFSLASTLQIDRIVLVQESAGTKPLIHDVPFELKRGSAPESVQEVSIPAQFVTSGLMTLDVHYHGVIDDPPRDPRHLRFVTPSETAGHIGPEGVYISSESSWYPDVPESLSTFTLQVAVPAGWTAVTQGKAGESRACPAGLCRDENMVLTKWAVTQPPPGHLDPLAAARALELLAPQVAVPIHWGTLAPVVAGRHARGHSESPAHEFAEHAAALAPGVDVVVIPPGGTVELWAGQ